MSAQTKVLIKVPNPAEAAAIVQSLQEAGIQATADGHGVVGWQVEAPAMIRVVVHQDDFERGREVLQQSRQEAELIDWDNVDVGVPEE